MDTLIGDLDDTLDLLGYDDDDDDEELAGYGEEIVGDDEMDYDAELDEILAGEDDDDEIGRRRSKKARRKRRKAKLARARMKALRKVRNRQLRRYPLGLGATSIGAGATAIIAANPQLPFRVQRLVTPSTGLLIDNLAVGTVSQFVSAGAVPVEVFAPNSFAVSLRGDTAVPGVQVQITVSNPTGGALTFSGAIIGAVAQ